MPRHFPRYEKLLFLYPRDYRQQYSQQILQTLEDMLDDQPSANGKARVWLRVAIDFPINVINQNTLAIGGNMHSTPQYIKRNGLAAAILLLPFVAALVANRFDETIFNRTLYNSWLWSTPAIIIWVMILPALAFILAIASYALYVASNKPNKKIAYKLFDLKSMWPIAITGVLALGILFLLVFHDSAHCWVQNPVYFVTKFHETWQCTNNGMLGGR